MRIAPVENRASNARERIWSVVFFAVFFGAFLLAVFGKNAGWIPALIAGVLVAFALGWLISVMRAWGSLSRYGEAWLELAAPPMPGQPLQATLHYEKGTGRLSRLLLTLECWTCNPHGVKQERLHFVRTVAEVARAGRGAEASIRLDIPVDAPASRTPPALRVEGDRSFAGTPASKSGHFTIWELSVSSGTLEEVGVGRRFFLPVGEGDVPPRAGEVADADAAALPAARPAVLPIAALVVANLVPLAGVLHFGWKIRDVVMLYWLENLVVGAYNVLRILTLNADRFQALRDAGAGPGSLVPRLGVALFFSAHYGMFCAVHGVFLLVFFFDKPSFGFLPPIPETLGGLLRDPAIVAALLALVVSHGISFLRYHVAAGERNRIEAGAQMMQPYGRVVVTHVAVLAGGFLVTEMKEPLAFLLLLVVLKTVLDMHAHWREHTRARSRRG